MAGNTGQDAGKEIQEIVDTAITNQLDKDRPIKKIALTFFLVPPKNEGDETFFIKMLCFENPPTCIHVMITRDANGTVVYRGSCNKYMRVRDPVSTDGNEYN